MRVWETLLDHLSTVEVFFPCGLHGAEKVVFALNVSKFP